ncbi:motility protein A [Mediterraneibacter sp. NSJ-55]|uniref:Motility protein A n=1 Tax=Mediterraneibacter hominis TaxID=2763054 RepID=A0A923RR56_9FIRM|nr:motility protein A [Mediterraneibacter hominis]MBC5689343.1 motility protein A [Mediterraneibacter hominis]
MDITSILGIVAGFLFVIYGIMDSGNIMNFFDVPSILIVVGGTIGAIVASFPFRDLKNIGKHMAIICSSKRYRPEPVIDTLVEFAQTARKDGLLALESRASELADPFLKKSIMYVVDAMDAEKIRSTLEQDIENTSQRHEAEMEIYIRGSAYAPAFGMIGTLIGLINMLREMDLSTGASEELGANMAVALVTTFYGCMLANLVFHPISSKLRIRDEEERVYKEIIVEGVLGIQEGDNPKNLKERLVSSLAQKKQMQLLDETDPRERKGKKKK